MESSISRSLLQFRVEFVQGTICNSVDERPRSRCTWERKRIGNVSVAAKTCLGDHRSLLRAKGFGESDTDVGPKLCFASVGLLSPTKSPAFSRCRRKFPGQFFLGSRHSVENLSARLNTPARFKARPGDNRGRNESLASGKCSVLERTGIENNLLLGFRKSRKLWKAFGETTGVVLVAARFETLRSIKAAALSNSGAESKSIGTAVLMEVEGVIADVHRFGHRQGFNLAFQELGLDCAQWSEIVFADLHRAVGGVEENMLTMFFNRIGWPAALPTNQQVAFTRKVLQTKTKALEKLAVMGGIPLRPGLEKFVDEVLEAGVPLVILGAYTKGGEQLARLLVEKLGSERSNGIKVLGVADVENSSYGQLVLGEGVSSGLDEQLAEAASLAVATEKQRIAEKVASLLQLSVEIDTTFPVESKRVIASLRAGAEVGGVEVDRCVLLASGLAGSQAASRIGMPCVVVRSSSTARGEFPAAKVVLDGYGAGSITFNRLLKFL